MKTNYINNIIYIIIIKKILHKKNIRIIYVLIYIKMLTILRKLFLLAILDIYLEIIYFTALCKLTILFKCKLLNILTSLNKFEYFNFIISKVLFRLQI
jgi:hypothetical protein